jgi:hypothetical protein
MDTEQNEYKRQEETTLECAALLLSCSWVLVLVIVLEGEVTVRLWGLAAARGVLECSAWWMPLTKGRAISTSVCALEEESPLAVGLLLVLMDMFVYASMRLWERGETKWIERDKRRWIDAVRLLVAFRGGLFEWARRKNEIGILSRVERASVLIRHQYEWQRWMLKVDKKIKLSVYKCIGDEYTEMNKYRWEFFN